MVEEVRRTLGRCEPDAIMLSIEKNLLILEERQSEHARAHLVVVQSITEIPETAGGRRNTREHEGEADVQSQRERETPPSAALADTQLARTRTYTGRERERRRKEDTQKTLAERRKKEGQNPGAKKGVYVDQFLSGVYHRCTDRYTRLRVCTQTDLRGQKESPPLQISLSGCMCGLGLASRYLITERGKMWRPQTRERQTYTTAVLELPSAFFASKQKALIMQKPTRKNQIYPAIPHTQAYTTSYCRYIATYVCIFTCIYLCRCRRMFWGVLERLPSTTAETPPNSGVHTHTDTRILHAYMYVSIQTRSCLICILPVWLLIALYVPVYGHVRVIRWDRFLPLPLFTRASRQTSTHVYLHMQTPTHLQKQRAGMRSEKKDPPAGVRTYTDTHGHACTDLQHRQGGSMQVRSRTDLSLRGRERLRGSSPAGPVCLSVQGLSECSLTLPCVCRGSPQVSTTDASARRRRR